MRRRENNAVTVAVPGPTERAGVEPVAGACAGRDSPEARRPSHPQGRPDVNVVYSFDAFLSHNTKDKALVRPPAKRLRKDGHRFSPLPLADEETPERRFRTLWPPTTQMETAADAEEQEFWANERVAPRR